MVSFPGTLNRQHREEVSRSCFGNSFRNTVPKASWQMSIYTHTNTAICPDPLTSYKVKGNVILYSCLISQVTEKECLLLALAFGEEEEKTIQRVILDPTEKRLGKTFCFHTEPWQICPSVSKQKAKWCFYTFFPLFSLPRWCEWWYSSKCPQCDSRELQNTTVEICCYSLVFT